MTRHAQEQRLCAILRSNEWFMAVLRAARLCDLPEWYVGAGVIRNVAWDHLFGCGRPSAVQDVDVAFFDAADLSRDRDRTAQARLRDLLPAVPWEATNQAAVHLWYHECFGLRVPPLASCEEAVGTWPETATSVAVRLRADDDILVAAPLGLCDLLSGVLRRNPCRVSRELFAERLRSKRILEKWPAVRVVFE